MLRRSLRLLAKRTPGYVFWRQHSLVELENAKRNYLLSERPVPIAEVARRMVKVKARFESTNDFHEKNLLRGEYKYFTGKLCDVRAARASDMIAFLQCGAFFGFWDAAQAERVMAELLLRLLELTANELVCLFVCLPSLRRQTGELYGKVARALVDVVPELTVSECLAVCGASAEGAPVPLLRALLRALEGEMDALTPAQLVDLMDTVSAAPAALQPQCADLWEGAKARAVGRSNELGCMDVAVLYTTLQARGDGDGQSSARLVRRFLSQAPSAACARSTAMMFSAVGAESLGASLQFAQAMEQRALFLATDFTPAELLAVFQVYLSCLVAMAALVESHTASVRAAPQAAVPASLTKELWEASQRKAAFRRVLGELSDQLVALLDSAAAYVSLEQQVTLLDVYATAVVDLAAATGASVDGHGGNGAAAGVLLRELPQTRTAMKLLADKLIAKLRTASQVELKQLRELAGELRPCGLPDAVLAATVLELTARGKSLRNAE